MVSQHTLMRRLQQGQGLVEYALILVLVSVVSIIVLLALGDNIASTYTCIVLSSQSQSQSGDAPVIRELNIHDADTERQVMMLPCGASVKAADLPTNMSIVATTDPIDTGSIRYELSGPINHVQQEDQLPYAIFGDNSGDLNGQTLLPGLYTIRATPYSQNNYAGTPGMTYVIRFRVLD